MAPEKTGRLTGPDLVRVTACFTVLSVHFFLNNGFYSEIVTGPRMFVMVLMRSAFMVCVPLFLLLTGYLMRNKKLEKRYYAKGVKTLVIYLLACAACITYKLVFQHAAPELGVFLAILNYKAAPYAWYIEMYFGLFMLIPFLNILYHGLPGKNAKRALIGTMLFLTALPQLVNVYAFGTPGWWANPAADTNGYVQLLPQWWRAFYPVTYYFIGAYVGEYGVRLPKLPCLGLAVGSSLVNGLYNFWRSAGGKFIWGVWAEWGAILNLAPAVFLFLFLVQFKGEKLPRPVKSVLGLVSDFSLGIYLVSSIFDTAFYPVLKRAVPVMQDRLPYYFVIVPAVFLCSMIVSGAMELIWTLCSMAVKRLRAAHRPPELPST